MGLLLVFSLLAYICVAAIQRPHVGVIGYYGFALLQPEWNWRWSLPPDFQYQKYIAACTLIGFLLTGMPGNRLNGTAYRSITAIGIFLALAYISAMSSIAPAASSFYLDNLWKIVLMAVLAVRLIDTPKKAVALLWVLVLAQGYNAYQINLQYFQDGHSIWAVRGFGNKGDNNVYSILTIPIIACALALAIHAGKPWQKGLAAIIALLQIHQIMLLESRGCMLGGIVMLGVFVWRMPKTRQTITAVLVMAILGGVLAGPPVIKEFMSSFEGEGARDSSAESRFDLWAAGLAITKDYPAFGVGPYAGQYLVPQYYSGGLNSRVKGLHNLVFEISTGCGVPALIAYLFYFAIPVYSSHKTLCRKGNEDWSACVSLAVLSGLIGYWTASMFSSGALMESSYACAAIGISTQAILTNEADSHTDIECL